MFTTGLFVQSHSLCCLAILHVIMQKQKSSAWRMTLQQATCQGLIHPHVSMAQAMARLFARPSR